MPRLEIPEEYTIGFVYLIGLSDQSFQELASALDATPFELKHTAIANNVASQTPNIPKEEVDEVLDLLVALNIVRGNANVTTAEFVDDVCDGLEEFENPELDLTDGQRETFKQRLAQLLDNKALGVASKARLLQLEHEHRYCDARILTDIRPLFSSDIELQPVAAVITHTLRVKYHQSNDLKEIYVVLKSSDLEDLRVAIERAEKKANGLKALLDGAKLSYLE